MNYCPLYQTVAGSEAFLESSITQQGIWLNLLMYCTRAENYGRIAGFASWTARKVMRVLRVPLAKLRAGSALWAVEDGDLVVYGYPTEQQINLEYRRKILADNYRKSRVLNDAEFSGEVELDARPPARAIDSSDPGCVEQLSLPVRSAPIPIQKAGEEKEQIVGFVRTMGGQALSPEETEKAIKESLGYMNEGKSATEEPVSKPSPDAPREASIWYAGIGRDLTPEELEAELGKRPKSDDIDAFYDFCRQANAMQLKANPAKYNKVTEAPLPTLSRKDVYCTAKTDAEEVFKQFAGTDYAGLTLCINTLMPGWARMAQFAPWEIAGMRSNLQNIKALNPEEWALLWRYYRKFVGKKDSGYWAPVSRQRLLESFVDVYNHCLRWRGV